MFKYSKNKIIWVDMDEVLAGTFGLMLEHGKSLWYFQKLTFDRLTEHYWDNIDGETEDREQLMNIWHDFLDKEENIQRIPVIEWSKKWIQKLKENGFNLHIITARHSKLEKTTQEWVRNHFSDFFQNIHFANDNSKQSQPKYSICQDIGASLMIEDNLDYALELADNGVACFLLEKPWNRHRTEEHERIKRVKNWEEIVEGL